MLHNRMRPGRCSTHNTQLFRKLVLLRKGQVERKDIQCHKFKFQISVIAKQERQFCFVHSVLYFSKKWDLISDRNLLDSETDLK